MRRDVGVGRELAAPLAHRARLLDLAELEQRLRKEAGHRREDVPLAHGVEGVVGGAQLPLGRLEVAGEPLDARRLHAEPRLVHLEAELLEDRPPPGGKLPRMVELALHRVEGRQHGEHDSLRLPVPGRQLDRGLAALDRLVHERGAERCGRGVRRRGTPLLADVAGLLRVLDRMTGGDGGLTEPAGDAGDPCEQAPGHREACFVGRVPEDLDRGGDLLLDGGGVPVLVARPQPHE